MEDITLLMRVVEDNDDQALYEITDIYLEKIGQWLLPYENSCSDDKEDYTQECALVISEHILTKNFLDQERVKLIKYGATQDIEKIFASLENELKKMCISAVDALKKNDENSKKTFEKMAAMINIVNEGAIRFKEEFYMEPTPDQLASYIGISEDDILEAMEASGYTITGIDFDLPEKI